MKQISIFILNNNSEYPESAYKKCKILEKKKKRLDFCGHILLSGFRSALTAAHADGWVTSGRRYHKMSPPYLHVYIIHVGIHVW